MYISKFNSVPRLLPGQLLCQLLLSLLLLLSCSSSWQVVAVPVTESFSSTRATYDGQSYELSAAVGETKPIIVKLWSPTIKGGGISIIGFKSGTVPPAANVSFTDATVTDSTITVNSIFSSGSYVSISGTKAAMKADTMLFDFRQISPGNGVVFYIVDTTATWTSSIGGGVVLALVGKFRLAMSDYSGFYLVRTKATGAMHMIKIYGDTCYSYYCLDMYQGLLAIDYADCINCNGAFFYSTPLRGIANSMAGVYRFQNCTHTTPTANQAFFDSIGLFSFGPRGNIIFSSITTNGPLFNRRTGQYALCYTETQLVIHHINAKSMGTEVDPLFSSDPSKRPAGCQIYAGNITLNGRLIPETAAEYKKLNINYTKLIDRFGMVIESLDNVNDAAVQKETSAVYCIRNGYNGVYKEQLPPQKAVDIAAANGITLKRWYRSRCQCIGNKTEPYCSFGFDPLLYPVGYTYESPSCTTDPVSCRVCKWAYWDECAECNTNYKFNAEGKCVPMVCQGEGCASCVDDSETLCRTCKDGYRQSGTTCILKTCAKAPCTACVSLTGAADECKSCAAPYALNTGTKQCTDCIDNYKWNTGGTTCIEKTCAKAPCTACVSPTGAADECKSCAAPYALNTGTKQCTDCIDNYKWNTGGTTCIEKTCAKAPCTACVSPTGAADECKSCAAPYALNTGTKQCTDCIDNYKWNTGGTTCIEKTCAKPPSTGCNSPSGNEDTSTGCTSPYILNALTYQCDACIDNYKLDGDTCIEKTCAKPPSTGCNSPSGNEDISTGCTSPYILNALTYQCDACIDNYKLDGDTCIEKTCAKPPSTGCNSPSGNEDISTGCTSPYIVNALTSQCDACIDNYKYNGTLCIEKTCAKPPSTGCNSPSGNEDISTGCTSPYIVNALTSQCDACIDNYKYNGMLCIEKTCAKPPSTGCNSPSGNEDISTGCTLPHVLHSVTGQCNNCTVEYRYNTTHHTCDLVPCLADKCTECVAGESHLCKTCEGGAAPDSSQRCAADSDKNGLSTSVMAGIIVAVVVVVLLLVFLLIFFCCCRRPREAYEEVEHITRNEAGGEGGATTTTKNKDHPAPAETEMEDVEMLPIDLEAVDGNGRGQNPLAAGSDDTTIPTIQGGGRRRTRRARTLRRNQPDISEVDLDGMYDGTNEIDEDDSFQAL